MGSRLCSIKFELEILDNEGYLPILHIKLKIVESGNIITKHYQKAANRGTTLHSDSHHLSTTNKAIVNNEID